MTKGWLTYENSGGFYTFGGTTRMYAANLSKRLGADVFEVKEAKKRNIFTAFFPGCTQAMRQAAVPLAGGAPDLSGYDRVIIACPVWAGFPAPAFNAILKLIPVGKEVAVHLLSGGGETPKGRPLVEVRVADEKLRMVEYLDVKAGK
ncbi:MAG: flavodoxin family protein [Candidatus Howiella sp.]